MDAAVGFHRPGSEGLHRRGVRHVELAGLQAEDRVIGSLRQDPPGRVLALGGVAGGEHDVEAMERELAGGLEANAAVGARDHRYGPRRQAVQPSLVGLVGERPEEGDLAAALLAPLPRRLLPLLPHLSLFFEENLSPTLASVDGNDHPAQQWGWKYLDLLL